MNKIELRAISEAARTSVELEGFVVPGNALAEAQRYIEGEINIQELINILYRQAKKSSDTND